MGDKCKHGIRDTTTNIPYCRRCDDELKGSTATCKEPDDANANLYAENAELRRQNEALRDLLEATRHYSIGNGVPSSWFISRDKALTTPCPKT